MASGPGRSHRKGISLPELFRLFPDDAAAEWWLIEQRWQGEITCPRCQSTRVQTGASHPTMPMRCRDCRRRFSVRTGTPMEASNLGYQVWVIAMYMMTTSLKGVSSMRLHRDLNISQKSAWHLANRLRETWREDDDLPFAGPVEADETLVGGKAKSMHVHRMSPEHVHRYLAEFVGRHNVRDLDTIDQMASLVRSMEGRRLRYDDLTAHRHGRRARAT